jgi:hypothetical protein
MERAPASRSRWPVWVGYGAAAWSLVYGALGLFWTLGGPGFPFGEGDFEADAVASILTGARASATAPVIAVLGLAGAIVAVAMTRGWGRGVVRWAMIAFGWAAAVVLVVLLVDFRLLMLVTRLPFMPVWAFTGVPGGYTVADLIPWTRLNLLVLVIGGVLWALATRSYQRRTRGACPACGRNSARPSSGWDTPEATLRWGRWAVYVAVFVPLLYAITRIAWGVGIPLGIPQQFYDENVDSGMFVAGFIIAAMAIGGCVLTLGLIQRWGEVYPRWIWFKAGKRVPPLLAIIPGSVIAMFVLSAGITEIRMAVVHGVGVGADQWAMTGPGWLWPIWGVALGAATYAYYLRRRTACVHCGLGLDKAPELPALKAQTVNAA